MTARLLAATKFSVPALPGGYVPRPRLHAALDAAAALPLTVVVGVPGAGKSVMLASWLHDRPGLRSAWLSCDARDADPATFWLALSASLAQTWPERWLDTIDLLAEQQPDLDDVAITVVNDLADLGEPVVLVIDDFEFAAAAVPSLSTLIGRLPAGCRVVVASQAEPRLAQHRLRAYGQLLEIRDPELQLTRAEVAAVTREYGARLNETEIGILTARTEGWMAGVQMAAVSLRDRRDPELFLADLAKTPGAITDFLGTEVLGRQPPEIRDFLLATSVLDVLDADSCTAVTGRSDADALLGQLKERNLFLIELDGVYRYHHLFAGLLRHRLRTRDPDRERALHQRAAAFFVGSGDPENAIGHFLAAGQEAAAFGVFRSNVVDAFYQADGGILRRLIARIGMCSATIDPARLPDLALALAASGPAGEAKPWIVRASKHAADLSDAQRARLAVAEGLLALQYGEAVDIERAFSGYGRPEDFPDEELADFVPGIRARGKLWLGDLKGARQLCEQGEGPFAGVSLTSELAWVACVEGQLTEAGLLAGQALASAASMGLAGHPIMVEAICAQGRVAFERGDLVSAERLFEQSISISEEIRPAFALVSQLLLARVWLADGRVGDALDGIAHARAFLPPDSTSPLRGLCQALEGRAAIQIGDLDRAGECARRLKSGNRAALLRTRIGIARAEFDQASEALARCAPVTMRERLDVVVLAARIACGRRSDDAGPLLAAAIEAAKAEGFVVAVADDLVNVRLQVTRLLRSRHIGKYEQALLDRLESGLPLVKAYGGDAGPLSDRELTVLRYLTSRLTTREVAAALFVSTNTVKTHVKRIYIKLGVSSRTEAVAEARRLGVL
ncbi:MAG TPA: LuxR C-terminal-related transcriptional regulator [Trebonia sp.]|nr:LuxR C-terminal-related transcriptional regulator [Trebonia sp.]